MPTYSQSSEVRVINEYVNTPAYVPPVVCTHPAGQPALGAQPMNSGFPNVNNFFVPFPYGSNPNKSVDLFFLLVKNNI